LGGVDESQVVLHCGDLLKEVVNRQTFVVAH
jgi:hypothetical protein